MRTETQITASALRCEIKRLNRIIFTKDLDIEKLESRIKFLEERMMRLEQAAFRAVLN